MIERKFLKESIKRLKLQDYVKKELYRAGIVDVNIQRTTLATRIGVVAERPGLVIGRKGKTIKDLSESIKKELGIDNPQIEVVDVTNPSLEAMVIVRWIKRMLERGMKPKRMVKRAISRIMEAGATGAEIIVKGTVSKGSKARKERAAAGYLKKAGEIVHKINEARDQAVLKQGVMGITVRIVRPDIIFPDKFKSVEEFKELVEKDLEGEVEPEEKPKDEKEEKPKKVEKKPKPPKKKKEKKEEVKKEPKNEKKVEEKKKLK